MISLKVPESNGPLAGTLPKGWRLCRLKSVASIRYGLGQPPEQLSSGVAMIRATDVDAGTIRTCNLLRVDPEGLPADRNPYLKKGEIIVVRSGAYTGDSAIVPSALEGAVVGYDMVATVIRASPHFVAYSLLSKYVLEDQIHLLTLRAAQPHLNAEELGSVLLTIPPTRQEQDRIVAYLDAVCAAIDAAVAGKRRQLKTLDALASSIINRAVTCGCEEQASFTSTGVVWFPEVPSNWRVVWFKSLFRIIYRYPTYFNIEYVPEGVPEVRGEALTPDGFIETLPDERYISLETSSLFPKTQLELGDIVMSVRGTMGKIGLVKENYVGANITANLLRLSPDKHRVTGEFLRWLMRSAYFNEALNSSAPQTTIKTITMPHLAKLRVALPPKPEQHRICVFLEEKLADGNRIASSIETQVATLTAYRKSLIHECVTGQRRITEEDLNKVRAHG